MTFGAAKALERTRIDAGKTLAVVGGTNGIGKAMALKFAALGVSRIILVGRNAERAGEVQKACEAAVPDGVALETQFVKADLS
jgi:NAD(P)-dependent dehydrogenase (short-subunit alcohol dehydrogenase family)